MAEVEADSKKIITAKRAEGDKTVREIDVELKEKRGLAGLKI